MITAYILIKLDPNNPEQAKEVLSELRGVSAISEAWATYGYYDIFLRVETNTTEGIKPVQESLKKIAGVKRTVTLMPYEEFKR